MTSLLHMLAEQNPIDRFFLPPRASNIADGVDWQWNFVLGVTTFFFVVVVGAMVFFVIKYRRKGPNEVTSAITHNTPLEIMWTGIPLILVMVIFYIGFKGFLHYDTPRADCRPIETTAQSWSFSFKYPEGGTSPNLYLLKGQPVVLNITSTDVLHAVYIPAFRTQRNAIFGRITQIWFIPEMVSPAFINDKNPGGFDLFCTQYCGKQHSQMGARVYVYDNTPEGTAEFNKKMVELANPFKEGNKWVPYAKVGEGFYKTYGCATCHSVDGTKITGPSWKGLWHDPAGVEFEGGIPALPGNASDSQWEAYIAESIVTPSAKIVKGYQNQMPPFSQFGGNEAANEKLRAVVEYMKSIGHDADKYKAPDTNAPEWTADEKHPVHPQSLAAEKAKDRAAPK